MEITNTDLLLTGIFLGLVVLCYQVNNILILITPAKAERINFYAEVNGIKRKVEGMQFLKVTQSLPFFLKITDKKGNPAQVDGAPVWAVSDESLASLSVAEDGMSATLTPIGPLGSFSVQVKADADRGEGVKEIIGVEQVELSAGDAEVIALSAGQPADI